MADRKEKRPDEEAERKIPMFTVIKNNAILKNIYVISEPPPPSKPAISEPESPTKAKNEEKIDQEMEETLTVGRHPDCNIMLTHPSISRFHLQILIKPSLQELSVIDLSSVHGTWVSDKRIEPGVRVELKEDDIIRLGGSTRVYRLHWIPLSRAYDVDNPFVIPTDMSISEDKEEENAALEAANSVLKGENTVFEAENAVKTYQDDYAWSIDKESIDEKHSLVVEAKEVETCQVIHDRNSELAENEETPSLDLVLEGIDSLFADQNLELVRKEENTSAHLKLINDTILDGKRDDNPPRNEHEVREISSLLSSPKETRNQQFDEDKQSSHEFVIKHISERENKENSRRRKKNSGPLMSLDSCGPIEEVVARETESQRPSQESSECTEGISRLSTGRLMMKSANSSLPNVEIPSEINARNICKQNKNQEPLFSLQQTSERENAGSIAANQKLKLQVDVNYTGKLEEEAGKQNLLKDGQEEIKIWNSFSASLAAESVNSCLPVVEVLSDITENKDSQTPQSHAIAPVLSEINNSGCSSLKLDKRSSMRCIWSRRGKPSAALQIQTSRSKGKTRRVGYNGEVGLQEKEDTENRSVSQALFPDSEETEEDIFTPNKENLTPTTRLLKSLKDTGKLEEIEHPSFSSNVAFSPSIQPREGVTPSSDKENQTPKLLHEQKPAKRTSRKQVKLDEKEPAMKRRTERIPFQSLLVNSGGKSGSNVATSLAAARSSSSSIGCSQTIEGRITSPPNNNYVGQGKRWTIIVDTTSLLDKESRKSLQLLQGLKGTQLIIPRIVIRELDCLKRRGGLFRRTTEVCAVLEWVEECMMRTKWWINVQSSAEEVRSIAPTPPASPQSGFSDGNGRFSCQKISSVPFSLHGNFVEIVSPTAEDHIIDCALLYRKMNDGPLVLLSNDVTLKIKAMAEGLICETAQEFRESLVNPFSERFLWADSSPRGLTWSHLDDVVLREKYNSCPLKKSSKGEGAKGLKLILLHNSHYGHINSLG